MGEVCVRVDKCVIAIDSCVQGSTPTSSGPLGHDPVVLIIIVFEYLISM